DGSPRSINTSSSGISSDTLGGQDFAQEAAMSSKRLGLGLAFRLTGVFFATQAMNAQAGADKGATVYAAQKCSVCHSLDGKGNAKGPLDAVGSTLRADK